MPAHVRGSGEEFTSGDGDLGVESAVGEVGGLGTCLDSSLVAMSLFFRRFLSDLDRSHRSLEVTRRIYGTSRILCGGIRRFGLYRGGRGLLLGGLARENGGILGRIWDYTCFLGGSDSVQDFDTIKLGSLLLLHRQDLGMLVSEGLDLSLDILELAIAVVDVGGGGGGRLDWGFCIYSEGISICGFEEIGHHCVARGGLSFSGDTHGCDDMIHTLAEVLARNIPSRVLPVWESKFA
jgi:hypothetical protein